MTAASVVIIVFAFLAGLLLGHVWGIEHTLRGHARAQAEAIRKRGER